jgi:CheY-like chemotaxis protein
VLLAEDDPDLREVLAITLREEGHRVTEVADGNLLAGVLAATVRGPGPPVDLVVTDVRMPGRTGLAVLEGMRDKPDCPPFVIMTAFGDEVVRQQAQRLGAIGVLDKPFSPSALRELVNRHARGD